MTVSISYNIEKENSNTCDLICNDLASDWLLGQGDDWFWPLVGWYGFLYDVIVVSSSNNDIQPTDQAGVNYVSIPAHSRVHIIQNVFMKILIENDWLLNLSIFDKELTPTL